MAAFVWKLSVVLLVIPITPMLTVRADNDDYEYCNSCTRLFDDFNQELNGTVAEDLFLRVCVDLLGDDNDSVELCRENGDDLLGILRNFLQAGYNSEQICFLFGYCDFPEASQTAQFAKIHQNHLSRKVQFQKLMAKSLKVLKSIKGSKLVKPSKH